MAPLDYVYAGPSSIVINTISQPIRTHLNASMPDRDYSYYRMFGSEIKIIADVEIQSNWYVYFPLNSEEGRDIGYGI